MSLTSIIKGVSMNDELNNETLEPEQSAPQSEEAAGEVVEQPVSNGYEKRISTLTARNMHKDQELNQLKAENATLKAAKEQPKEVAAPELPNEDLRFEDEAAYKKQVSDYHKAVAAESLREAQKDAESNRVASEKQKAEQASSQRQQEIVTSYVDSGIKAGISEVKMQANEQVLAMHKITPELAEFIYSDANGAQIVDYLADNPDKIQELMSSGSGHAYIKIANEIKPQALSTKPTHTNAPDPITPTRGGGSTVSDGLHPLLAGATFT